MNMLPQTITTSRLKLRLPSIKDVTAIFEQYAWDEEVTKYMTWRSHSNIETTQKYLEECLNDIAAKTAWYWMILHNQSSKISSALVFQYYDRYALDSQNRV